MQRDYRQRLYEHYVSGGRSNAPAGIEGLAPREPWLTDFIARHFPAERDAQIVDLGCGYGALLHFARAAGYSHISGVDVSAEQVEAARRLGIDGVSQGDLLETLTALPEASQDVVVALDVVEHFAKQELLACVDAVRRVLRPGGRWIILVPNGSSPLFGRIRYGDLTHELAFTADSISQLLLASDFREVLCFENVPVRRGAKGWGRWLVWKGIRGLLRVYLAAETGNTGRRAIFTQNLLAVAVR